jgi:hypothetical protein
MVPNTCNKVANALTKLALLNDFSRRPSHMIVIVIIVLIFYLMHLIGWENLTKKEVAITTKLALFKNPTLLFFPTV